MMKWLKVTRVSSSVMTKIYAHAAERIESLNLKAPSVNIT